MNPAMSMSQTKLREHFEEKMQMVAEANGVHAKCRLLMMAGPVDSETIYNMMYACFVSGAAYGHDCALKST